MAQEELRLAFADGEYLFRLNLYGIKEIQEKCGAGIGKVWSRLASSRLNHLGEDIGHPQLADFRIEDIVEPIRQALIGGGQGEVDGVAVKVTPILANRLIENYVLSRPLQEGWATAYAIVGGLVEGYDLGNPNKKKVSETESEPTTKEDLITQQP